MGATILGSGCLHSCIFVSVISPSALSVLRGFVEPQLSTPVTWIASEPPHEINGMGKPQGIL
jgi:hypothetical protein